jgi:hypothetical protein
MWYRLLTLLLAVINCSVNINAQHQELNERPQIYKNKLSESADSNSFLSMFTLGKFSGNARYYFSSTDNTRQLSDYYAHALGVGLHYETARYHSFQAGISGYSIFNLGSSKLNIPDSSTGLMNRYEIGLFDIESPESKYAITKLEELFLKFSFRQSYVKFGKQFINTPFINLQDGRMHPTAVEGLWLELNELKNSRLEFGLLYAITPRSSSHWFDIGSSVGIYPTGINPDGKKSGYRNNTRSKGIAMIGYQNTGITNMKFQIWDLFAENILNVLMLQFDYNVMINEKLMSFTSLQFIHENAVGDGGNPDIKKAFITPGSTASCYGLKTGLKINNWEWSINYNRIGDQGRYLMPREWGRDPFFTFLARERNEGLGDVHAFMSKLQYHKKSKGIKISFAAGHYILPDVTNTALNKFSMPSYTQLNLEMRYTFQGILKGLESQFLFIRKINAGSIYQDDKNVFNKVDVSIYNLVLNYFF